MKTSMGLWIDHRKAVIVEVSDQGEETRIIESNVEKQLGRIDGLRSTIPFEAQKVPADDSQEKKYTSQLNTYYDDVISAIRDTESLFIFGPGQAKTELKKRLEKDSLDGLITAVETVDVMTDPQIAAKVRDYFKK